MTAVLYSDTSYHVTIYSTVHSYRFAGISYSGGGGIGAGERDD